MNKITHVAYLGPEGTFSHLVARKRFGAKMTLIPLPSIFDVFDYVRAKPSRAGVVPIENSSGGTIYETVDCLIEGKPLAIREELSMNVRLALLGHKGEPIKAVYSHFAPMQHCDSWLKQHLPEAVRHAVSSTARAAEAAATEPNSAALGRRDAGKRYKLDVLEYPVHQDVPNLTQFFVVGQQAKPEADSSKMTLVVTLPNAPGALCDFLDAFRKGQVNLTRILSRPITGKPKLYYFFVDLEGTRKEKRVATALAAAGLVTETLREIGVYPVRKAYVS